MSAPNPLSERLRFAEFVLDRLPNGRCRAKWNYKYGSGKSSKDARKRVRHRQYSSSR